jgi:hypothetical protein
MNDFDSLMKSISVYKNQKLDVDQLIESFISKYDLSGVTANKGNLKEVTNNIEAAIKAQFDLQGVEQQIAAIRKETSSKQVVKGIQQLLNKHKDNTMMNEEILKAIQQIQSGMKSNEKYK